VPRSTIGKVIPGYNRQNDIVQPESPGSLNQSFGFGRGYALLDTVIHTAESAVSCAMGSQDQEGGRAAAKTFRTVRTAGFFADGRKVSLSKEPFHGPFFVKLDAFDPDPLREAAMG